MKEVSNILRILLDTKNLISSEDGKSIKDLSNQTLHSATVYQDPDNIIVAVLIYSIGKIMERPYYKKMKGWDEFYSVVLKNLDYAIKHLEKDEIEKARVHLGKIRNSLNKIEGDLSLYIRDVFAKAEINKAFKLYEHGLSSEQTAKLLGVSLWDMASYIGQSSISESHAGVSMNVKKRIKLAEELFG